MENKNWLIYIYWITLWLLVFLSLHSCTGWSVSGYEISNRDSSNVKFEVIISSDKKEHWYHNAIFNDENWCYRHNIWEDVKTKEKNDG